jgi:DNA-binding transcriptional LysR family regulator
MRGVTLRQLTAFSVVARHRSFGRAALELHVTRSAVSMQIKELEQQMGLALFGRGRKTAVLTTSGEALLRDVNRALLALQDAQDRLIMLRGRETGSVSVGMVCNAEFFLPRVLAVFRAAHPDVELRVSVGNREKLVRQLAEGEVTLAVMGQPPEDADLEATALADHLLGIVAAPHHELAHRWRISAAEVTRYPFVAREPGSGTRAAADRFFRAAGCVPKYTMELAGNESVKQAVMGNMGLAFVSLQTSTLELQTRMLVKLDVVGLPLIRHWHVVHFRGESLSRSAESLRDVIVAISADVIRARFEPAGAGRLEDIAPVAAQV